jgi:hypothetical protein
MREAVTQILQMRMDKCTSEQFWAVGAVTALNAYLLSQKSTLQGLIPVWAVLGLTVALVVYAVYFVIHRHVAYFDLLNDLVDMLKDEAGMPRLLRMRHQPWKVSNLSGVAFYCGCIVVGGGTVFLAYL